MKLQTIISEVVSDKRGYKYILALLFIGVCLMLLPTGSTNKGAEKVNSTETLPYNIEAEEKRLADMISSIQGAGKCKVLLSVQTGVETVLAKDDDQTLVLSKGGNQSTVTVQQRNPAIQGAVIVVEGCSNSTVRYDILSAVKAYTGLGADKITICPIEH